MKTFLKNLIHIVLHVFHYKYALYYVLTAIITFAIVYTGFDWQYNLWVHSNINPQIDLLRYMDILGFLLIPVFFIALLMAKKVTQSSFYAKLFELHLYCLFAAIICSTIIKALVGRQSPPHFHGSRGLDKMSGWVDNSTNFNFGFLNEQVFGGFPSSHATVYFALAFSIYYFLQTDISKKYIRTLSQNGKFLIQASSVCMFVLALSIGLGVSLGHHWFSEFVAGLVLGLVIAKVVREMKKNTVGL